MLAPAENTDAKSPFAAPNPPAERPRLKIIVGLGNPGARYAGTRHNMGFACIDKLAQRWSIPLSDRRQHAVLGQGEVTGAPVVLAKPRTYMNNSGEAVHYLLARFRVQAAALVIIYDEMDLPRGTIRRRPRGGTAGHQGMASIIDALGSNKFPRVRVGIGSPPEGTDGMDYVLEPFSQEERPVNERAVKTVCQAVVCLLQEGIQTAMNRFNSVK